MPTTICDQASLGIPFAEGVLPRECLEVVVVPVEHEVGAALLEDLPERARERIVAVLQAGAVERLVPEGGRAAVAVLLQIGAQPLELRRVRAAVDDVAVRVERDDVPA